MYALNVEFIFLSLYIVIVDDLLQYVLQHLAHRICLFICLCVLRYTMLMDNDITGFQVPRDLNDKVASLVTYCCD